MPVATPKPAPITTTMTVKQQQQQIPSHQTDFDPKYSPEVFTAQYIATQSEPTTPTNSSEEASPSISNMVLATSGYVRPSIFVSPSEDLEESERFFYEQYSKKRHLGLVSMGLMSGVAESLR